MPILVVVSWIVLHSLLLRPLERLRSIVMSSSVCDCVSVCLPVREHISGTVHAIFTNFSVHAAYGCGSVLLWQGDEIPRRRGNFWGCSGRSKALTIFTAAIAAAFAPRMIIQSPITSCSRRDHSVRQASANRNPENSERRRCGLSAGKRMMGVHSAGEVWYLRLPCCIVLIPVHLVALRVFRLMTQFPMTHRSV